MYGIGLALTDVRYRSQSRIWHDQPTFGMPNDPALPNLGEICTKMLIAQQTVNVYLDDGFWHRLECLGEASWRSTGGRWKPNMEAQRNFHPDQELVPSPTALAFQLT